MAELTYRISVKDTATGETFRWDELSEKEKDSIRYRMSQNLSGRMSQYFTEHPEEYERL